MNKWEIKNMKLLIFGFWLQLRKLNIYWKTCWKKLRFSFFIDWIKNVKLEFINKCYWLRVISKKFFRYFNNIPNILHIILLFNIYFYKHFLHLIIIIDYIISWSINTKFAFF